MSSFRVCLLGCILIIHSCSICLPWWTSRLTCLSLLPVSDGGRAFLTVVGRFDGVRAVLTVVGFFDGGRAVQVVQGGGEEAGQLDAGDHRAAPAGDHHQHEEGNIRQAG